MQPHALPMCFLRSVTLTRRWTVSKRLQLLTAIVCAFLPFPAFAAVGNDQNPKLDQVFQSAVAHYHAGQLPEAAAQLEQLLPQVPRSFEVHELLGLVYAAQSQTRKPSNSSRQPFI